MAFEISDTTPKKQRDILAKKRDRVIKRQQEREEELRRKKFEFEEQKRISEREKSVKEETINDIKKIENERREAILKNHKATKSTPTKTKKANDAGKVKTYFLYSRYSRIVTFFDFLFKFSKKNTTKNKSRNFPPNVLFFKKNRNYCTAVYTQFDPLNDCLYGKLHIILKRRNVQICEHSIFFNY